MEMQELYKYLIQDYLKISSEQIVVLSGLIDPQDNSHTSDISHLEELALIIRNQGAFPSLDLSSKSLKLRILAETPEEKYFVPTDYYLNWVKLIDVIIDLSFPEIRNIFTDNLFTAQKKDLINKSLHTIYKNMLIAEKTVLLPNFPKKSIADYYNIDLSVLEDFYKSTFESIDKKMNAKGSKILNRLLPATAYYIKDKEDDSKKLKITISDQQSYFITNKINNFYTVLPYGYVAFTVDKNQLDGTIKAEKLYYKDTCIDAVEITFSYGNIVSIQFPENKSISEILKVGMINSKERVEFFIGVNNGVTAHCNYNYYDRCIDNNFSLVFYDELNHTIEISSSCVELTNLNMKNILL